uniref:Apolipoprotein L2-like n=1 Tax=Jaculus jaculus TaxID=51337 RepID=A0A8C5K6I9_JACJA
EEEETLREALIELTADMAVDDTDGHQDDPQDRKVFLDAYPQLKRELEERIEKLRALADKVDQVHRDCTITNVVADSASAASGVLTILGLALAPVTAGVSLMLSATGMGLGAAAAVTRVTSSIVDHKNRLSAEAEVSRLHSAGNSTVRDMQDTAGQTVPEALFLCPRLKGLAGIGRNIRAIRIAQANPRLLANAKRLMAAGRLSARNTKRVQKAFGGTALAMTKGARVASGAAAGLFLLMDVASLVKESLHLHEGAKSGSAAELRRQAEELEEKLKELTRIHDNL